MTILDTLLNRDSRVEALLARYPVSELPHPGKGIGLTPAQRQENLTVFLATKADRIGALTTFMASLDVHLPTPGDPALDAPAVSQALDALAKKRFAKIAGFEAACAPGWRERIADRTQAPLLAVATDLGVYVGECATHASEPFNWGFGETRYRAANMPSTAGEIIITKLSPLGRQPNRVQLDVLAWSVEAVWEVVRNRRRKAFWRANMFEFLDELMANRY